MPNRVRADAEASSSVDKALRLLELIGERQALRVSEAADLLGVARSTAHRLLTALSRRAVRVGDRTGVLLPAHCTAAGKAILAALPRAELARRYRDRELTTRTPASIATWEALDAELEVIRREGFARNRQEGESGVCALAMAARDLTEAPLAAIAVVMPSSRAPGPEQTAELVVAMRGSVKTIEGLLQAEL
jgi:DNA-binding IclR family transcriptional regulator